MKLAASIRYGGQLIKASEVGYQDYRHLGLICPHCGDPVFLAAAHDRHLTTGVVSQVPAQFRHFKASDPVLVQACVARVAQYDAVEIQKRAAAARHQRLKTLQRWFWSILTARASCIVLYLEDPDYKESRVLSEQLLQPVRQLFLESGEQDIDRSLKFLLSPGWGDFGVSDTLLKEDLRRLPKLDLQLHTAVCKEVLHFFLSRSSTHMFNQAVVASIGISYLGEASKRALDNGNDITHVAYVKLLGLLTVIPWVDEFSVCEQQQKRQTVPTYA